MLDANRRSRAHVAQHQRPRPRQVHSSDRSRHVSSALPGSPAPPDPGERLGGRDPPSYSGAEARRKLPEQLPSSSLDKLVLTWLELDQSVRESN
eukprot:15440777-Alexandrium_andersonii.AAC.1